ncbi:MAG: tRNA pseudouridine(38-40) synthase TruA [Oscillospiraceae bacterium]|nr:tRNA pseudouridine(38-40) synthase TruA [Oscillospiraceae bacterium]
MNNFALTLAYDGTPFCGWQLQPNGESIQQNIEHAIEQATGAHSRITGCSRTDAGVHAREFVCNFFSSTHISTEQLPAALNFYLPPQIAVRACRAVPQNFHARYDCKAKTYRYHIHNSPVRDPFLLNHATQISRPLDENFLHTQAQDFIGTHEFAAFCAAGSSVKTTVRTVTHASVHRDGNSVYFTVRGEGFLYHMVRIMVGTLLHLAAGKLEPGSIPAIIASGDRAQAGPTAPAQGLCLWQVEY